MKVLFKKWGIVGVVMVGVFCVGIVCLFYFKSGGENFSGIEKFEVENAAEFSEENSGADTGAGAGDTTDGTGDSTGIGGSAISGGSEKNDEKKNGNGNNSKKSKDEIYVHIIGKIRNEGVIALSKGQRIIDAIEKAGGVTEEADLSKVNLAYVLSDGQKVRIPGVNDDVNQREEYVTSGSGNNIVQGGGGVGYGIKVNVNTASQTELETISGVGPSLAAKIINYREKNGKFKNIEELKNVSGIGDAKFEGMKDFVDV